MTWGSMIGLPKKGGGLQVLRVDDIGKVLAVRVRLREVCGGR